MLGELGLYESHAQFAFSRNGDPMCIYREPSLPIEETSSGSISPSWPTSGDARL